MVEEKDKDIEYLKKKYLDLRVQQVVKIQNSDVKVRNPSVPCDK